MKIEVDNLNLNINRKNNLIFLRGSSNMIKNPILNEDFALFLGLLYGDGWLVNRNSAKKKNQWRIGLVEDDKQLINYYSELVKNIFAITPRIHDRKTKIEVYFNNRIVYEILNQNFKFPDGKKINRLKISENILNSKKFIIPFLKGLFSTDGKFVVYKGYPRVGLDSATKNFIDEVAFVLKQLGFNPRQYTWNRKEGNKLYGLYLNGKNQVSIFYRKIGFIGEKVKKLENFINININSPVV